MGSAAAIHLYQFQQASRPMMVTSVFPMALSSVFTLTRCAALSVFFR